MPYLEPISWFFHQEVPTANVEATQIPLEMQELLVNSPPDWTSPVRKKL